MIIESLPKVNFFSRTKRLAEILLVLFGFLRIFAALRMDSSTSDEETQRQLARWTKNRFITLGPTFIKLGQQISARSDLFPSVWVEEFSTLQDKVEPFSAEQAIQIIEEELGKPINEVFVTFNRDPLSTASIGQVHRAQCLDGHAIVENVVKVQRPGVAELVKLDLSVLRSIVQHLVLFPRLTTDLFGFLRQMEKTFETELDYRLEAANTAQFLKIHRDDSGILIAPVDHDRSSKRVLTMRYLSGTKVSQFAGTDEEVVEVARILIAAFLKQFVVEGVFHADPHPGNIAVSDQGRVGVIMYDFGMVGRLSPKIRDALLRIAILAFTQDADGLIAECVKAGILNKRVLGDPDVRNVIARFIANLDNVSAESIGLLMQQLSNASESGGIEFPSELILVGRSLIAIEGLLKELQTLYPGLDLASLIQSEMLPLITKVSGEPSDVLERLGFDADRVKRALLVLFRASGRLFAQIEKGTLKISVKDDETAAAIRKLRFGFKSVSASVFSAVFFNQGIRVVDEVLLELDGEYRLVLQGALGLSLLALAVVWLERWYKNQNRMDRIDY